MDEINENYGYMNLPDVIKGNKVPDILHDSTELDTYLEAYDLIDAEAERIDKALHNLTNQKKAIQRIRDKVHDYYDGQIIKLYKDKGLNILKGKSWTSSAGREVKFKTHNKKIRTVTPRQKPEELAKHPVYGSAVEKTVIPEHITYRVDKNKLKSILEHECQGPGKKPDDDLFIYELYPNEDVTY